MILLDRTFPLPEQNLACDEALLDAAEEEDGPETLRFWESDRYFVVVGSSNRISREVHLAACEEDGVPVLRRRSGGGAVVQGPGCLNFSLVLRMQGDLSTIAGTNRFVLSRVCRALQPLTTQELLPRGLSDLAVGTMKVSGNSQRRRLRFLLFHGTILYNFDVGLVERYLAQPSKEPDYREGRPHRAFITNLRVKPEDAKAVLARAWGAVDGTALPSGERIRNLVRTRYGEPSWNFRL